VSHVSLQLAAHGLWPGSARSTALLWAVWVLALTAVAAALAVSAKNFREARPDPLQASMLVPATAAKRAQSPTEQVLDRLRIADPKAAALQTLYLALEGARGSQLVSVGFSALPASPDQLDSMNATIQLRGPYATVKQVLAQWTARFETSSLISLRLQRSPTTPGVVEATASAALWTRPAAPPPADAAASAPAGR
jgi:hypothetical protein